MASGEYRHLITWQKRSVTKDTVNGQDVESFANNGTLWAEVVEDSGRNETDYGTSQTGSYSTIRVQNLPALSALDRVTHAGRTWIIDKIRKVNDGIKTPELSCDCFCYDDLQLEVPT